MKNKQNFEQKNNNYNGGTRTLLYNYNQDLVCKGNID